MGCNSKKEDEPGYVQSSSTAVTAFKLKPNSSVMKNLDSVYFSIDLEHGVIYNADSLPMGTPVTKLIPQITYPTECTGAVIRMSGGALKEGEVDYKSSPTDTIDFSGNVTLTLTAQNGMDSRTYRLKVNVHKVKPDSLCFDKQATTLLPSRKENPLAQKTVQYKDGVISIIKESDGGWTAATSARTVNWVKTPFTPLFTPEVRTLTSVNDVLYILDTNGVLHKSNDGLNWLATGKTWSNILGAYGNDLLGLRKENGKYLHTSLSGVYPEEEVPAGFPVKDASNMLCLTNRWAVDPIGFITGGETQSGETVEGTWGFDGHTWAMVSNTPPPALKGAVVAPYFVYKQTSAMWLQTEFPVMMLFGGELKDGALNKSTYISIDNGVNWTEAPDNLSLPDNIPPFRNADIAVLSTPMSGSLADAWQDKPNKIRKRLNYKLEGYDIYWDCPYIYLFGGETADDRLNTVVWRGILSRLTFMPLF